MFKNKNLTIGDIINKQYKILENYDSKQHSSKIYKGLDITKGNLVVIKITSALQKEKNKNVTKILQKLRGGIGIPNILWRGIEGTQIITITECLGPNLKKLFLLMDKKFSVPTICMIAIQVLNTLEYIHKHDYVCCNVMPKEILISLHKRNMTLYITDFKQAKKIKNGKIISSDNDTNHLAHKAILNKFSSVNLHLGLTPSTKDDLESLGYILIYFFKEGNLFERSIKTTKEEKIKFYEQQKLSLVPDMFCNGIPSEMAIYMNYIKSLQSSHISDKPDYEFLRKLFRNLYIKNTHPNYEFRYDWLTKARTYTFDNQSKCTDRGNNCDISFTALDIAPSSLMVTTPKDIREGVTVSNTSFYTNFRENNNNPFSNPDLGGTLGGVNGGGPNGAGSGSINSNGIISNGGVGSAGNGLLSKANSIFASEKSGQSQSPTIKSNKYDNGSNNNSIDKIYMKKKSLFNAYSKEKSNDNEYIYIDHGEDNSNYHLKDEDLLEQYDPNDSLERKVDVLRTFSNDVKTIENIKHSTRPGISNSLDSMITKKTVLGFQLKKAFT